MCIGEQRQEFIFMTEIQAVPSMNLLMKILSSPIFALSVTALLMVEPSERGILKNLTMAIWTDPNYGNLASPGYGSLTNLIGVVATEDIWNCFRWCIRRLLLSIIM